MNILDTGDLPTMTLNIVGREGDATSVMLINQETKSSVSLTNFTYTQGETLEVTIDDDDFLNDINSETTLSLIVFASDIPLYRDVVRFRGELSTSGSFFEHDISDEYYIYESSVSGNLIENPNFTSHGENLMTTFTNLNEDSSHVIGGTEEEPFLTVSGANNLDGVSVDGLDNLEAGRMYRISMNLSYQGTDRGRVSVFIGGRSFSYDTNDGSGFTTYVYAEESDLSMSMYLRVGSDAADLIVSQYSVKVLEGWKVSGDNALSFITPLTSGFSRETFGEFSTVSLSTLTSDTELENAATYKFTGNVITEGAGMDIMQGETVLGTISDNGLFELEFTSGSTEGISFKYPASTDTFRIEDISLVST